jgi:hypothetical protein
MKVAAFMLDSVHSGLWQHLLPSQAFVLLGSEYMLESVYMRRSSSPWPCRLSGLSSTSLYLGVAGECAEISGHLWSWVRDQVSF